MISLASQVYPLKDGQLDSAFPPSRFQLQNPTSPHRWLITLKHNIITSPPLPYRTRPPQPTLFLSPLLSYSLSKKKKQFLSFLLLLLLSRWIYISPSKLLYQVLQSASILFYPKRTCLLRSFFSPWTFTFHQVSSFPSPHLSIYIYTFLLFYFF